jgi:glutathione synthase
MNILVLTDHKSHTANNSFYLIVNSLQDHPQVEKVFVCSRSDAFNNSFFNGEKVKLKVKALDDYIDFESFDKWIAQDNVEVTSFDAFDFILLRLPRPIAPGFFNLLKEQFDEKKIVNRPSGIEKTGSKAYLVNFNEYCAPLAIVQSIEEIIEFKERYGTVLKPLEEYGGKGIIRIDQQVVYLGNDVQISFKEFAASYKESPTTYLAMKYLKNVSKGDKRIVVANGEILTSSTRYPAEGSWLCNVAQGGSAELSQPTEREVEIVEHITPILKKEGIFLYGLDTLQNDEGIRVISEINTLSVGGIAPAESMSSDNLGKRYADLFVNFVKSI